MIIFVFGSNLAGIHGAGAAAYAAKFHGAEFGVGIGRTGNCFAIPTKDAKIRTLPLNEIKPYVDQFIAYATKRGELNFLVTEVGTGLAGYSHDDMAPLFKGVPRNCFMPSIWSGKY